MDESKEAPKRADKIVFGLATRVLAGCAGLLFLLPERVFTAKPNGLVIRSEVLC
jgi:hypothetical protein